MTSTGLLLKAYYERLYERMGKRHSRLVAMIDRLLPAQIDEQGFGPLSRDEVSAYRDACLAFVTERLEAYNPIGIQYTFDRTTTRKAAELEFQLNWYDSRKEFDELLTAARELADEDISDERLPDLADQLILRVGAFPDRSIVAAYIAAPTLTKLPDYVLACAIEQVVCERQ